jgi:type VI protein secretion system component VasK
MAVPLNTTSHTERALQALAREQKEDADGRAAAWAVVWTLFTFKMVTVAIIWYAASGSSEANGLLAATTWYWIFIPIIAFSGAIGYRWRLVQARRQRHVLRDAEWRGQEEGTETSLSDEDVRRLLRPVSPQERSKG